MTFSYRILRQPTCYRLCEVYEESGQLKGWAELDIVGDSPEEIIQELEQMLEDVKKSIVLVEDEITENKVDEAFTVPVLYNGKLEEWKVTERAFRNKEDELTADA